MSRGRSVRVDTRNHGHELTFGASAEVTGCASHSWDNGVVSARTESAQNTATPQGIPTERPDGSISLGVN